MLCDAEWRALEAAIDAGVGAIQLREKDLDGGPLLARAERLLARCRRAGVRLLVNDRVDVALAAGADGVHLPGDGLPVHEARELLGERALVGRSVHRVDELGAAAGADFVVFGPVFETPSKRSFGPPQGIARLAELCRASELPVIAVGGITPARIAAVRAAGAAGVAVIGAILEAPDPGAVVREMRRELGSPAGPTA